MPKYSTKRIRLPDALPGMALGIVIGLLLTGLGATHGGRPTGATPPSAPDIAHMSLSELTGLPRAALSHLCDDSAAATTSALPTAELVKRRNLSGESLIRAGVRNTRRLLPIAKRLSIKALLEWSAPTGLRARKLSRELAKIRAVDRIILDGGLGDTAAVQEGSLRKIRIGSGYAELLISDDQAVFLLAHELTHVAARTGRLASLIESVSQTARVAANVEVGDDQKEDLACDFIATQVLKDFIDRYPTNESKAERLLHTCGYALPSERLEQAWEDFCASYNGFAGDGQHLSQGLLIRALAGLDPELKAFIDGFSDNTRHHER